MKKIDDMLAELKEDSGFQTLIKKYESPNCFTIMGRTRREEWHSNFIMWILNPTGNHGLGTFPLMSLLNLVNNKNDKGIRIEIDEEELKKMKFNTEEYIDSKDICGRMDIFGNTKSLILVIENKVHASESDNQTDRYYKHCEEKFHEKQKCYIYLKPDNNKSVPNNENFIVITYQDFFEDVIAPCIDRTEIGTDARMVLEQYAINLSNPNYVRKEHMAYTEKELAEQIYSRCKNVFEDLRECAKKVDLSKENSYQKYKGYIDEILGALGMELIIREEEPDEKEKAYKEYWDAFKDYLSANTDIECSFSVPQRGQSWIHIKTGGKEDWHIELKALNDGTIRVLYYGKKDVIKFFKREYLEVILEEWGELEGLEWDSQENLNRYEDTIKSAQGNRAEVSMSYCRIADWKAREMWESQFDWFSTMLKIMIPRGEIMYNHYYEEG